MTYINWDLPFCFDPTTFETVPLGTEGAECAPTYGLYGGGGYPGPEELLVKQNGNPYSYNKLVQLSDRGPVDIADYYFYEHDVLSMGPYSPEADVHLLNRLVALDASYDAGASLYAGGATLAMLASLEAHGFLFDFLSLSQVIAAFTDAFNDIEYGLQNLPPNELASAWTYFLALTDLDNFAFASTTTSFREEFSELAAMNTLNEVLDAREGDAPADTGLPFPGTTDSLMFEYNAFTYDLVRDWA